MIQESINMGILEKISEIEKEIARTQKNKGKRMISNWIIFPTEYCDKTEQPNEGYEFIK